MWTFYKAKFFEKWQVEQLSNTTEKGNTRQKMKFSFMGFLSKYDQICSEKQTGAVFSS